MEADSAWIPGRGDHASIHANHIDMCKFDHREDQGYRSVAGAIKKFAGMKTEENRSVVSSNPQKLDEAENNQGGGTNFHNYGDVKNQVGGDQHIAGNMVFQ